MQKNIEKALNDFVDLTDFIQLFVKNPDGIGKLVSELRTETLAYRDALGANNTLKKAEAYLSEAVERENASRRNLEDSKFRAESIVREAESQASTLRQETLNDRQAAKQLRDQEQALKDKAQGEHAAREKDLVARKQDLDTLQSNLNRRAANIEEQEKALADKVRRMTEAAK